jgi:uncharacterized protein
MGNHRSFQHEAELLMMPAYDRSRSVVPVTAMYGANASGKSNLVDGLQFMANAVRWSYSRWEPFARVPRQPFRLDLVCAVAPSLFVVEAVLEGVRYTYGFSVDDERVREEWLYSYPEKRRRVLFDRNDEQVRFGTTIPEQRGKAGVLTELLRPNSLFLSLAGHTNITPLLPMYQWFARALRFHGPRSPRLDVERVAHYVNQNPTRSEEFARFLAAADLGIGGIRVERDEDPTWRQHLSIIEDRVEMARRFLGEGDEETRALAAATLQHAEGKLAELRESPDRTKPRLVFLHGPRQVEFNIGEESDGTLAWLSMLPQCLDTLGTGGVLVVDEIDSSLHPRLTAFLVGLFQNPDTNPRNAQLLFTTHDTTLLGPVLGEQVLHRDQVWFVEKDEGGGSKLYPLTDFRPRVGENAERRYLAGSYGAVPIVPDVGVTVIAHANG